MNHRERFILMILSLILVMAIGARVAGFIGSNSETTSITLILPAGSERDLEHLMSGIRDAASTEKMYVNTCYAKDWTREDLQKTMDKSEKDGADAVFLVYPEKFMSNLEFSTPVYTLVLTDEKTDRDGIAGYPDFSERGNTESGADMKQEQTATSYELSGKLDVSRLRREVVETKETIVLPNAYKMGYDCMMALKTSTNTRKNVIAPVGESLEIDQEALADGRYDSLLTE